MTYGSAGRMEAGDIGFTVRSERLIEPTSHGAILGGATIEIEHGLGDQAQFYRHGWNSWSPTGWTRLRDEPLRIYDNPERLLTADDTANDAPEAHSGSAVGMLDLGDDTVLLLGGLGLDVPTVRADQVALTGVTESGGPHSRWYVARGPEEEVLRHYAQLLRDRYGHANGRSGRVWSSWYAYFEDIDETTIATVVRDLDGYPVDVIQIDDGWERSVGDWQPNARFPSGMKALAESIRGTGRRAGLWVAPMICKLDSEFATGNRKLMIQGDDGEPMIAGYNWGGPYWALDTTQPRVQEHLHEVFTELSVAGFDYFKLDFMYAAALRGRRHQDGPREQVYREAVEAIRQAVGPEVYLLGCGVPMLASIGVFDGVRVGPDTAPYWDNAERHRDQSGASAVNALKTSLHRAWMAPLYECDPDVVFFRSRRSLLDDESLRVLHDLARVMNFRSTSDPIAWLDEAERSQLRDFLSETSHVRRLGRYQFEIDGRTVDFGPYVSPTAKVAERLLVR